MFENLFKDLRTTLRNGCLISGMDCSDIKFNIDEDDIRSHKSGVYLVFRNKKLIYIGYTGYFNENKPKNNRPCCSKHTIAEYLDNTCQIQVLYNLPKVVAHTLEAYLIKYSGKQLTKQGQSWLGDEYLLNKRYEKKWEKLIDKFIIQNGNHPFSFTWRQTDNN